MPIPSPTQLTTFSSLPLSSGDGSSPVSVPDHHQTKEDTYLLATIKSNLTITKPTLILTDSTSQDFALVFDPPSAVISEPYSPDAVADKFKQLGLKKGNTVVIKNATRTNKKASAEREGAGQGFVVLRSLGRLQSEGLVVGSKGEGRGEEEEVEGGGELLGVVPSGIFLTTKVMMDILRRRDESLPEEREEKMCDGKFDGCGTPRGKEEEEKEGGPEGPRGLKRCQGCVEVWYCSKECQTRRWSAHKSECKTIKAVRGIWPRPEGVE